MPEEKPTPEQPLDQFGTEVRKPTIDTRPKRSAEEINTREKWKTRFTRMGMAAGGLLVLVMSYGAIGSAFGAPSIPELYRQLIDPQDKETETIDPETVSEMLSTATAAFETMTPTPSLTPEPSPTLTNTPEATATSIFSPEELEKSFLVQTPGGEQRIFWNQELAANPNHKKSYFRTISLPGYFKMTMQTGELPNNVLMFKIRGLEEDPIDNIVAVEGLQESNGGPLVFYIPKVPGSEIAAWELYDSPHQNHAFESGIMAYGKNPNSGREMVKTGNSEEFEDMEGFFFTLRDIRKNRVTPTPTSSVNRGSRMSLAMSNRESLSQLAAKNRNRG